MRPINYLGSKAASGASQAIIALMPPHNTYIETHLGGGAVMAAKPPAIENIGIDIDPETLDFARNNRLREYSGNLLLHCKDAHRFLEDYLFTGNELIYCDPPYLHSTRSSNTRYRYEYTESQHKELLTLLRQINTSIILSGYPSQLYNDLLPDWKSYEFQVMTRGGVRTEKLWYNYEPARSYWATFAGRNYTHRQQIKRKAQRWANNYKKMSAGERRAILSALLQAD